MKTPTHDAVALRAREIWLAHGCPAGRDTEFWFEAVHQLAAGSSEPPADSEADENSRRVCAAQDATAFAQPGTDARASQVADGHPVSPPESEHREQDAERAVRQRKRARAPMLPVKFAPHPAPPESGKPIWRQPHSS